MQEMYIFKLRSFLFLKNDITHTEKRKKIDIIRMMFRIISKIISHASTSAFYVDFKKKNEYTENIESK